METNLENISKLLNNSEKVVGTRQVFRNLSEDRIRCAIISEDADDNLRLKIIAACNGKGIRIYNAPSMKWLGKEVGIEVGTVVVGILKSED